MCHVVTKAPRHRPESKAASFFSLIFLGRREQILRFEADSLRRTVEGNRHPETDLSLFDVLASEAGRFGGLKLQFHLMRRRPNPLRGYEVYCTPL